ncbi:MAG TPA: hypothetical protein VF787_05850 [Thermoanaerobaculia bacterium]
MTASNNEPQHEAPPPDQDERISMPKWIPILIGAVLVTIAGFAVFTGLRFREQEPLGGAVKERHEPGSSTPAPPGEPDAGASLMVHGEEGDTTPTANAPVEGRSRAVITGGPQGVQSVVRIWARRGMVLNVLPEDAMVFVNDVPIGHVNQFNTMDEVYDFAQPGSYTVRIVAPNGAESKYIVTASDDAKQEVARISAKL